MVNWFPLLKCCAYCIPSIYIIMGKYHMNITWFTFSIKHNFFLTFNHDCISKFHFMFVYDLCIKWRICY